MTKYARIQDGIVMETFETDQYIKTLFHPALIWVEAPDEVECWWTYDGKEFGVPEAIQEAS